MGETRSYSAIAIAIQRPTAFRAVAQANGANQLAIIIPCHRVINTNGELGGYGGGLTRKKWLINHEEKQHDYTIPKTILHHNKFDNSGCVHKKNS